MNPVAIAAAALVAVVVALVIWRLTRPRPLPPHQQVAACPSCGWKGVVSRYAGRCPACNTPLGERRARRPGA